MAARERVASGATVKALTVAGTSTFRAAELHVGLSSLPAFCDPPSLDDFLDLRDIRWSFNVVRNGLYRFCVPINPVVAGQRRRACALLELLRDCGIFSASAMTRSRRCASTHC